jgi:hypothetical protein
MFFNFFKKNQTKIPTIKANKDHKKDDKNKHKFFLNEVTFLLKEAKIFKPEYIKNHVALYNEYVPFRGVNYSLISNSKNFEESLLEPKNKTEAKKIVELIITVANARAHNKVELDRKKTLVSNVKILFPSSSICCNEVLKYKKKLEKKSIQIAKVPLFPLRSCINCDCKLPSQITFQYQIDILS